MRANSNKNNAAPVAPREALLLPDEAGEFLGFSRSWLAKLRMTGEGPKFIKLGRKVRYARADLDAWVAAGRASSTSDIGARHE